MYGFLLVFYSNFVPKNSITQELEIYDFKYAVTLKTGLWSVKVIKNVTIRQSVYDFLLTFHSNYGPILYRFQDRRWFQSKITKFSHTPCILCPILRGSPWNWLLALGVKKLEWRATGPTKKFDDNFSRVERMHQCDRQTDRWIPGDSKDSIYT